MKFAIFLTTRKKYFPKKKKKKLSPHTLFSFHARHHLRSDSEKQAGEHVWHAIMIARQIVFEFFFPSD